MNRVIVALGLAFQIAAGPLWAESDRLQPDFTFKRVKPPAANYRGPRITVQITPETAPMAAATPDAPGAPARSDTMTWFWDKVPADLATNPAVRLRTALDLMSSAAEARSVPAPRLQNLKTTTDSFGRHMLGASIGTKVSPALALAVIAVESGGQPDAVSSAGAQGLMQLMPATAARFDVDTPLSPDQNIRGGIAYLDWLLGEFEGDAILALAAYNAGEGAVRRSGGVPDYPETRAYVPKVLAAWQVARGLCQTPPQLMTDGCVFIRSQ